MPHGSHVGRKILRHPIVCVLTIALLLAVSHESGRAPYFFSLSSCAFYLIFFYFGYCFHTQYDTVMKYLKHPAVMVIGCAQRADGLAHAHDKSAVRRLFCHRRNILYAQAHHAVCMGQKANQEWIWHLSVSSNDYLCAVCLAGTAGYTAVGIVYWHCCRGISGIGLFDAAAAPVRIGCSDWRKINPAKMI